ncbi:MAG: histidine triad nucleotide-binding protein [Chloroflexi bacterium]|nr:histidine triad nucleotide-binding protein [Chloroflexota bacterium]
MDKDCLFCRIYRGEVPASLVHRDERLFAIRDIHPQAPVHILLMPVDHIPSLAGIKLHHASLLAELVLLSQRLAEEQGIAKTGYRVIANVGPDSGQAVDHLHLHLLGGRPLGPLISPGH